MEDTFRRLVEGRGKFVNDVELPGMLHMAVVRSPYARAKLLKVKGGINHSELKANLASVGEGASQGSSDIVEPVLALNYVNYVGQPVAAVLGEDPYEATDKMDEVEADYEPLKPVIDPEKALAAEPIHPGTKSNAVTSFRMGKEFELGNASIALEDTLSSERISPNPLEPRGLVASYDGSRLTVWASTQSVHTWKTGLCSTLGLPRESVRVIQMDTGGAFGSKSRVYPEYVIAGYASMKTRRPVKWIETRFEHLAATNQGRGARAKMKIFADGTGKVHGLKADLLIDCGAYAQGLAAGAPQWIGYQLTGPYAIQNVYVDATGVFTNKAPLGPYRGAGRPEAAFFTERMMDMLADELKIDPVEVRLRNASPKPFVSPLGLRVDPFKPFLESAARELNYYSKRGEDVGVGFSSFVLIAATRPGESAKVAVRQGRLKVWMGGSATGQGHEEFAKELVTKELGVPPSLVDFEKGDTDELDEGVGTWGSRTAVVGGAALVEALRKIKDQVKSKFGKYSTADLLKDKFDATVFRDQEDQVNSLGANLVTARLDSGTVKLVECAAYYDVGSAINPSMIESQVIGGSAQGIGQVLSEQVEYGDEGQLLTATLADAGVPTALSMPNVVVKLARNPSPLPHGAKGVGESPTMGVPPAAIRAIEKIVGKRLTETPIPMELITDLKR